VLSIKLRSDAGMPHGIFWIDELIPRPVLPNLSSNVPNGGTEITDHSEGQPKVSAESPWKWHMIVKRLHRGQ